ncbi:Potassium efflux system KefA protein / Small-conductance mechanosensitive channel [Enhygromyxa salina]|uniref:Potassium efflux system KefA protein / Small-conductance mechanosensitive channel n=1 Tax=Enhygromyxa salina TaxID=215803 RepID=A0A0C2D3T4_9BACT|nr:mechanosensitive ion channel domain-containing protein [Enhygromyxa salina]KIG14762.1 Potassium efflux system KefA protein / Small-conductance mechanosensitive channel [Enhygromyxa salina]
MTKTTQDPSSRLHALAGLSGLAAAAVVGLCPRLALAGPEEALSGAPPDAEVVSQFAEMIRWGGVLTSIVVLFGTWLVIRFMRDLVDRLSKQFANRRLLLQKVATVFQFVVYVVAGATVILLSLKLTPEVLTVIGGTVAVSVGFAAKDLVASFIAGIMIMVDRPFQVGDRITFGGQYGDITAIGLRSVRLQTLDDNTVTIPNNLFINDITSNGNYGALDMQVVMDFYIGVDQDVGLARSIVNEAAVTSRYVYLPKPVVVLVNQMIADNHVAVRLRVKSYVLDTKYEKAFETDVNLRVLGAFRQHDIMPPAVLHRQLDPLRSPPQTAVRPTMSQTG